MNDELHALLIPLAVLVVLLGLWYVLTHVGTLLAVAILEFLIGAVLLYRID